MQSDIFCYIDPTQPQGLSDGPLAGMSVAVQPNICVHGWPTEAGSLALDRFVSLEDATAVERLKASGARTVGSTYMSELGFGLSGSTADRAVAEGQVDIALLTDTMGEARISALRARAFGFKPSYGIVSRFGLIGLVPSMECLGILANKLEDIVTVMAEISGSDDRDLSMPEFGPGFELPDFNQLDEDRESIGIVGVIRESVDALTPSASEAFNASVSSLFQAGVKVQELSLQEFGLIPAVHKVIGSVEASSSSGKYDGVRYGHRSPEAKNWNEMYLKSRSESFGPLMKTYAFQGAYFQFEAYAAFENACRIRARVVKKTEELFNTADWLILPTRRPDFDAATASTINEVYDAFSLTCFANLTGLPAVVVPGLALDEDMDVGLQLVGPLLSDARLLSLGSRLSRPSKGDR